MQRLHFLTPDARRQPRFDPMFLVIPQWVFPTNMVSLRRIYRALRTAGWDRRKARWAIYDVLTIRAERAGTGYGL